MWGMKATIISIVVSGLLIGGALLLVSFDTTLESNTNVDNVSIVDGKQIIEIGAKGGYTPRVSIAKADTPTIIRVQTRGTFDCSSFLVIPNIDYRANLPPSGITEIEVPPQKPGTTIQGLCGMGMYNFKVQFN
ncbi:MAG: hypothetical protein Q8R26_01015 [bacterium]|nr:hypothetical protein [bacterium]